MHRNAHKGVEARTMRLIQKLWANFQGCAPVSSYSDAGDAWNSDGNHLKVLNAADYMGTRARQP